MKRPREGMGHFEYLDWLERRYCNLDTREEREMDLAREPEEDKVRIDGEEADGGAE